MKLEKINENQIRCTLTREDLADRNIRISELAYGSEKTQTLFKDMMHQAHDQLGFDADNTPLMIEAIPVTPDSIMLVITKVDNPEELDSRFANFAPAGKPQAEEIKITGADDIIGLLHKLYEAKKAANADQAKAVNKNIKPITDAKGADIAVKANDKKAKATNIEDIDLIRLYSFRDLDDVIRASVNLAGVYSGKNSLYKVKSEKPYKLVIHKASHSAEDFNRICNLLSEYGDAQACTAGKEAHMNEHEKIMLANNALQMLGTMK